MGVISAPLLQQKVSKKFTAVIIAVKHAVRLQFWTVLKYSTSCSSKLSVIFSRTHLLKVLLRCSEKGDHFYVNDSSHFVVAYFLIFFFNATNTMKYCERCFKCFIFYMIIVLLNCLQVLLYQNVLIAVIQLRLAIINCLKGITIIPGSGASWSQQNFL